MNVSRAKRKSIKRICLLCENVSRNSYGRAYALAMVLSRNYDVDIVGPRFGKSIWAPMAGLLESNGIRVTAVPGGHLPFFLGSAARLWRAIDADIVYALKPYPTSFGLGLLYGRWRHVPVILDIDDWELGGYKDRDRIELMKGILRDMGNPNNYLWMRALFGHVHRADAITVSSTFLQRMYGGVILPHGRDTSAMDPEKVSGDLIRRDYALEGKVVLFLGTPRPHKGVDDLVKAVSGLERNDVCCAIVGSKEGDSFVETLRTAGRGKIRIFPEVSFNRMPAWLAAADVVAIPQRATSFAQAQVPAKLFDAMAMGRPIVSTRVSDIPTILDGCGVIVAPGDVRELAGAIEALLKDPDKARAIGNAARKKCIGEYSWDVMQSRLGAVVEGLVTTN